MGRVNISTPPITSSLSPGGRPTPRVWLPILSKSYSGPILAALSELGQEFYPAPDGWEPHDGIPGSVWPDAVVWDCDCKRHAFFLAGYYRAAGVPVVYVSDSRGRATRRFAAVTGCYVVFGMAAFARWLATNPPYLHRG